jgi:quercetin dioxygenase-like cupin family protein
MPEPIYGPTALDAEMARFQPGDSTSGRRAETLVKTDDLRVVLVNLRAGATLAEHTAPGTITIHALRGNLTVDAEGTAHDLPAGSLISLEAGLRHAVHARTDGAFLLTIAWPAGSPERLAATEG